MPTSDIRGLRRTGTASVAGTVQYQLASNERDELIVAGGLPAYTEMTRLGDGWTVQTATAFTTVAASPTTAAALEVFNNRPGYALIVADVFAFQLLSTAATQTYGIWAMVTTSKAVPSFTALTSFSLSGKAAQVPTAAGLIVTGVGTTVVANGWRPWGNPQAWGTAAATPGNSWSAPVDGKLVAPPNTSVCVTVAGSIATASSFQCGMTYYWSPITVQS